MLRKLSPDAEKIVQQAKQIAREYQNEYLGTEHILLALVGMRKGLVRKILNHCNLDQDKVRAEVDKLAPRNPEQVMVFGEWPATPLTKNVIVHSIESAEKLHSDRVEPEHILLSLLEEEGTVARVVLNACGVDIASVRKHVADHVRAARQQAR